MKKLLLVFMLLPFMSFSQDMYYEKCSFYPALLTNWAPDVVDYYYEEANSCIPVGGQFLYDSTTYRMFRYYTNIACMGPLDCQPNLAGLEFDSCHWHYHLDVINSTISDMSGNILKTGAKLGYDWVDASKFRTIYEGDFHDCRRAALDLYGGWVEPGLPPNDNFNSTNLGMTAGYQDGYSKSFANNWVVVGHYENGNYIGLGDGDYIFHSVANFSALLDQGDNRFPDEFTVGVRFTGNVVTEIALPDPGITPSDPTNITIQYSKGSDPVVTWIGEADHFEIQTYIKKYGDNSPKAINKALNLATAQGNAYIDGQVRSAPMAIFGTDKGWKFYYKIRAVNGTLKSEWVRSKDKSL